MYKRQDLWCTINEPNVVATLGYLVGEFPPGQRSPLAPFRVTRNLLLAHAAAYHAIHCLLYTSDAADERSSVDLGGRRIIKKKKS